MSDATEIMLVGLIENRLQGWADDQDLKLALEGVAFKPPTNTIYARSKNLPATTFSQFIEGKHEALTGLWQVSVIAPANKGLGDARRIAATLKDVFPVNLRLTHSSGFAVQITTPVSIGPSIDDPASAKTANVMLPCSFTYRADSVL